ncbi:MAG: TonB-dependent receptor plug domain-containing protein, partial [Paramuribaculum sp.]|nr:TonB-dependent receptor plug domain-containing protein [Paramuribaculum sp.]
IAKVSEEVLTVGANANPAQALAGAVSGVKVNITSGDPGATPSIVVRGGTNWSGSSEPLVVVDGQIRSSLSDINPNDIESMDILKDAGATALYGARAANGVILVSTKQGKAGTSKVTFNGKFGINWYSAGYDFVDAETYLYYNRKGIYNTEWAQARGGLNSLNANNQPNGVGRTQLDAGTQWNVMTLTEDNKYLLEKGWQTMQDPIDADRTILFRSIRPQDVNINTPAYTQDYNVNFSGGNDRGQYYASLGYYDADGAFKTTFYKRYNFSFTGSYKIAPWLESQSTFTFTRSNKRRLPINFSEGGDDYASYIFGRLLSVPPTLRLLDEDNNPAFGQNWDNTNFNYQADAFIRKYQNDKFQMTQGFLATITKGLTVKGTMSWFYNEDFNYSYDKEYQTSPGAVPGATNGWNKTYGQSASFGRYFDQTYNLVANFNRTFAEKHTVNVMAGWEFYHRQYKSFSGSGQKLPSGDWFNLGLTFNGTQNPYQA